MNKNIYQLVFAPQPGSLQQKYLPVYYPSGGREYD